MSRAIEINVDPRVVATRLTESSHPKLFTALTIVAHDSGAGAGRTSYGIPPRWMDQLDALEAAVASLTDEELETFCIGEETEAEEIAGRSPLLMSAHQMLNEFFGGWEPQP